MPLLWPKWYPWHGTNPHVWTSNPTSAVQPKAASLSIGRLGKTQLVYLRCDMRVLFSNRKEKSMRTVGGEEWREEEKMEEGRIHRDGGEETRRREGNGDSQGFPMLTSSLPGPPFSTVSLHRGYCACICSANTHNSNKHANSWKCPFTYTKLHTSIMSLDQQCLEKYLWSERKEALILLLFEEGQTAQESWHNISKVPGENPKRS